MYGNRYGRQSNKVQRAAQPRTNTQRVQPQAPVRGRHTQIKGQAPQRAAGPAPQNINSKLKGQTASARRQNYNPHASYAQNRTKNTEVRRRINPEYRFYIKNKRQNALKLFMSRLVIFGWAFIALLIISIAAFYINLVTVNVDRSDFYYYISESDSSDYQIRTLKYDRVYRDGEYYIDLTSIAEYCDFVITGESDDIRFIASRERNDYVRFLVGTTNAEINGQRVTLTAPVYSYGDYVYVPVSFIDRYVSGLDAAAYGDDRAVAVKRMESVNEGAPDSAPTYTEISFKLKELPASESIPFGTLDSALLKLVKYPLPPEPEIDEELSPEDESEDAADLG